MNKLLVDNNTSMEQIVVDRDLDITINLSDTSSSLLIEVMPNVCLRVFDISKNTKNEITYNIEENSSVIINKLSIDCSDKIIININNELSKVEFYSSLINYKDNNYIEKINHNFKNSKSKIVNHCLNVLDNTLKLEVEGTIQKNCTESIFKQDNKIINLSNGKSYILPNLIVDNDDIEASHSAYIGTFDQEILFYMMTRGISKQDCRKLLIRAFLINSMKLEEQERDIMNGIIENI